MRKRLAVISAGVLAGLMALGTANALVLDTAPDTETVARESAVAGAETVYEVGDAGTVTIVNDGTRLQVASVNQNDGWTIEIEAATGREVEVDFRNGTRRIQFNAELEDGEIRVRARERVVAATSNTTPATNATTSATTATTAVGSASTSGTVIYQAGAAGTVTISRDGSALTITSVDAAPGWSHEIEVRVGREVEMDFRNGSDRIQFNAELEDGEIRVRVRTRAADGTRTEVTNGVDTTDDSSSGSSFDDDSNGNDDDDSHDDDDSSDDSSDDEGSSDDHDDDRRSGSDDDDDDSDDD